MPARWSGWRTRRSFSSCRCCSARARPTRADELLRLVAGEPDLAARVTGARLVGERRWDIYLDGRIEVRLPAERPEAAWRRLAAEQRATAVIARADHRDRPAQSRTG